MDEQDVGCGGGRASQFDPSLFAQPGHEKTECREAIETLYHFLDGELTERRRSEISQHLVECSPCLDAFDFEAELKMVIARKCRDQVPDALRERVRRALREASDDRLGPEDPRE
jgi:mycothiol system anti-sigma-R factor